jgi:signal transduction histidine kinase
MVAVIGCELGGNSFYVAVKLSDVFGWCRLESRSAGWYCFWFSLWDPWQTHVTTVTFVLLIAIATPLVISWCQRPIQDMVPVVAQMGPQNLGQRLRFRGKRRDVVTRLAAEVDAMMDRIATGYEGQRRFAANASHELRTPLAVQRMLIEVGMAEPLTADQISLLTKQLLQANERNERLIEGLLVLSETDQGLVASSPQRLDLIAAAVTARYEDEAASKQVRITTSLTPRVVDGEAVLLERLITNLVENAIKYNRADGAVEVHVGTSAALRVSNTGDVVPAQATESLFEPFKRLTGDRIDHSGGAGLGLTIARSVTSAHGGTITAQPAEGGGLVVTVDFPVSEGTPWHPPTRPPPASA